MRGSGNPTMLQWALAVLILCALLGLGMNHPIQDDNEGLYARIAAEMLDGGSWVVPHLDGVAYLEKPPLLYWLTALAFRAVGQSETAARAAPLLGEPIRRRQWLGVAISFCGVIVIATRGNPEGAATLSFNVGDLLALGSMAMWASYTVFLRLRRDALNTLEFLTVVCAFGLAWMTPWVLWEVAHGTQVLLSARGALAVAYSAIGSLLLAYAGWSYVVTRLGAARAGVTMHLMPALGVLMAMLFLGEVPHWFHFAGIALILSGVALSSSRARAAAPA